MKTIIVTGAAGFIGSAVCRLLRRENLARVVGIDAMTYAASRESIGILLNDPLFELIEADVADAAQMAQIFLRVQPDGVMHLAAETHVDRSIDSPAEFLRANIVGTYSLLETARIYRAALKPELRDDFRFLYVSTDEVYGSLTPDQPPLDETSAFAPNSPYAATKASADHLVRAWGQTYDIPVLISHGSNTYGPLQFPEKLIPLAIFKALAGEAIPIYGNGTNSRDWLYVDDHARALFTLLEKGRTGETYNVGGGCEKRNIDLITELCTALDALRPRADGQSYAKQITFVEDRPAHDLRYAMNSDKILRETGWAPATTLADGLHETIRWYLDNQMWCQAIRARKYDGQRLGRGK